MSKSVGKRKKEEHILQRGVAAVPTFWVGSVLKTTTNAIDVYKAC